MLHCLHLIDYTHIATLQSHMYMLIVTYLDKVCFNVDRSSKIMRTTNLEVFHITSSNYYYK